ncbi:MAG: hypothetical protein ABR874_11375 [Candidatus Sulfotelmatobacter sp.]|jgi:hypothetical protein
MKCSIVRTALLAVLALMGASAFAQNLAPNQTLGYGASQLLQFTYTQNFDCIDQPFDDLNYNGIVAAKDPGELQTPICTVGINPSINPPGQVGNPYITTEPIYVLVPMFSVNNDQNPNDAISCDDVVTGTLCGPALGTELITLFGAVPEAFKATPLVYTQCPEPGSAPGTCTMHASRLDLGPALAELGYIPHPTSNVFLPTPNHSHILINQDINLPAIWWQVIPVLITNQSDWPTQDGSSGITSQSALLAAKKAGTAIFAPSNFFLFFSSNAVNGHAMHMN